MRSSGVQTPADHMVATNSGSRRASLAIIAWVIGWSMASLGADYYVATDGADGNAGTSLSAPFRTIRRAATNMVAGDNCYLREGTYRETLAPSHSGSPLAPITFSAYSNEVATISAADEITGWTNHSGSIFRAAMDWDLGNGFNQVFVDGQMMVQARYPNTGLDPLRPILADMTASTNSIACSSLDQPDGFWTGGIVVGGFGERWSFQCARITASGPGSLSIAQQSYPWFYGSGQGYVCGVLGALDTTNEWHFESGTLYLWAPDDNMPAAHLVEAKRRAWCIDINGQSNIVVRGLKCFAGSVRVKGNACTLESCTARYLSHFTHFTWSGSSSTGGVNSGYNGVLVSGTNNLVTNCWFQYSAGSGVVLEGASNTMTRCVIRDTDYSGTYSCVLSLRGFNNRIHFNSMFNTGRDIIQLFGSRGDDLRYNDLYNCGLLCHDVGITYQWGVDGQGTRIAYNWIHDNLSEDGPGIYLDGYCRNFVIDHNVIWNLDCAGIRVNRPATNHLAYNNTLFACWDIGAHTYDAWFDANPEPSFWTTNFYQYASSNNLFLGSDPATQLQDYAQADFRLKPGAAAIDAGVVIPGFTDGYCGTAPDQGAYESEVMRWTAGTNGVPLEDRYEMSFTLTPVLDLYIDPVEGSWGTGQSGDAQNTNAYNDLIITNSTLLIARTGASGGDRRAFLKFDISSIPTNAAVRGATLWLYLEATEPWGGAFLRSVTSRSWNESNATYSLGSESESVLIADFAQTTLPEGPPPALGWHQADVTSTVADWVRGGASNFGLALTGTEGWASNSRQFASSRAGADALPRLIIDYSAPGPPPPRLSFTQILRRAPSHVVLTWPSESNRLYSVLITTNLLGPWRPLATNVPASAPMNSYTGQVDSASASFYWIKLQ